MFWKWNQNKDILRLRIKESVARNPALQEKLNLTICPRIPFLGICPREMKIYLHTFMKIFIASTLIKE